MGLRPRQRVPGRGKRGRDGDADRGVYRVEVDTEPHHFPAHGAFSFWSAVKYIFVLSLLLWWLPQNLGAMVAGYVGGRRAGAHWKAVLAALLPVLLLFAGQWLDDHGIGTGAIGFASNLPSSIAAGLAAAVPPARPYVEFLVAYLTTFVRALQTTFGMQANGYLIVIVFAYIGGIVGEQTRREMGEEVPSTSINIVQPVVERLRHIGRDDEAVEHRWLVRRALPEPSIEMARSRRNVYRARRQRGRTPDRLSQYRRVDAELERPLRASPRAARREPEPVHAAPPPESHHPDHDRDLATQRFVERALREYERPHRRAH